MKAPNFKPTRSGRAPAGGKRPRSIRRPRKAHRPLLEREYELLTQLSPVGIFKTDAAGRTTFVNPRWCELACLEADRALGDGWLAAVHPGDRAALDSGWMEAATSRRISVAEYRFLHPDGKIVWVMGQAVPETDARKRVVGYFGTITDITDRRLVEDSLRRKNRALTTLSACNQVLIHASREMELLDELCRVCTEIGGYRMAWVGYAQKDDEKTVRPMAQRGAEDGYVENLKISWGDDERGRGPTGTAIRTGQPCIARNVLEDPAYAPWRAVAVRLGYASSISLPLVAAEGTFGALNIYASEPDAFDAAELALLAELASDLAFGVSTLRIRAERERAEQALRENESRLASIYNTVGDVIFQLAARPDGAFEFSSVNHAFTRVTGLAASDVLGRRVDQVIPEPSLTMVLGKYRQAIESQSIVRWEETTTYPTGTLVGEVTVAPIRDASGACTGLVGSVHDVTDRKRAEEELRRDADEFEALYDIAHDLSAARALPELLQKIVNHTARLTQAADVIIYLYDPVQSEMELAAALVELRPLGTRYRADEGASGEVIKTRRSVVLDDYQTWGPRRPDLARAGMRAVAEVPMFYGEEIIGVLGIAQTSPERKYAPADVHLLELLAAHAAIAIRNARLMEQVKQANAELERRVDERTAQLQVANKELESFSYSVSHDLRAPLRAISGFSEIIARRHRASLNEEGQHYVDNIVQASERMGRLIDDLLQYSRIGRAGVRHDPVRLKDVVEPLAGDLAGRLSELSGTLTIAEGLPSVTGDRTLLTQIFSNLLENALTYRRPGVSPVVTIGWSRDGPNVVVRVADNGIGIPSEHLEKIFNVFQRLHSDDEYPGTGIGLATVKKAADLLRGRVWVESEPGVGSAFFVRLPEG